MKRVIIADDEPHMTRVLKQSLERAGFSVQTCHNGHEALLAVRHQPPDILVTDIQMPVMTGKELCHALQTEMPGRCFPIYVMTSMTDRDHREWTSRIEGITLLEKPLSMRILIQKFQAHVQTRSETGGDA